MQCTEHGSIEMSDLEEGEVVDSDCDESVARLPTAIEDSKDVGREKPNTDNAVTGFGSKASSENVTFSSMSSSVPGAEALSYRNHRSKNVSNSEDSCDTSDEDSVLWNQKRAKYISKHHHPDMDMNHESTLPLFRNPLTCQNGNEKRPKKWENNIWGSVLDEQCLTQGIKSFDVENSVKHLSDRNVESYDFTKAANDTRPFLDSDEDNMDGNPNVDDPFGGEVVDLEPNEGAGAIRPRKRKHVKKRLGERTYDKEKSREHIGVTKDDSEAKIVAALVEHLREPKVQLLSRVVDVLGKEKTLQLLYMTEDIEQSGGMMTLDASRRRTKGGVFIQLIKTDMHIEKKDVKEIFAEETKEQKKYLKALTKKRRRERLHDKDVYINQSTIMCVDKDSHTDDRDKHDGRGDRMDSSNLRRDENRPHNNSRNVVCYESDEKSDESIPLNTTTGSNDLSNEGDVSRESGDGASDSGTTVKTVPCAVSSVLDENVYDEDMLDIMPGEEETIE